jgi:hypothetical protein
MPKKHDSSTSDHYEREVHTPSKWELSHFNENFWSMMGMVMTPSDASVRSEVIGVATKEEAERICKAHNDEIAAIRSQVHKAANFVKKFHDSTPNCSCEVCAFKQQLLSALKLRHLTCRF